MEYRPHESGYRTKGLDELTGLTVCVFLPVSVLACERVTDTEREKTERGFAYVLRVGTRFRLVLVATPLWDGQTLPFMSATLWVSGIRTKHGWNLQCSASFVPLTQVSPSWKQTCFGNVLPCHVNSCVCILVFFCAKRLWWHSELLLKVTVRTPETPLSCLGWRWLPGIQQYADLNLNKGVVRDLVTNIVPACMLRL